MDWIAVTLALGLVVLNAFFVAFEFAIVKVRPTRIEELIRKHRPGASLVRRILTNIDGYLSATQLGITLASLGLGWIGEPAFARLLEVPFAALGMAQSAWLHNAALVCAFTTITFLHIVLGELAPKTVAILHAESVAISAAYLMRSFYVIFFPVIWLLNSIATGVLRFVGLNAATPGGDQHSEEEIKIILNQARSAGLLSADRSELLRKALTLPAKTARHLMVPRNEVICLDIEASFEQNMAWAMESGHTRFPLCNGELDDVIGVVNILEVLHAARNETVIDLRNFATPVPYFPEMMTGERLLREFRTRRTAMAIVVDEYGGASGIVTPSDVISAVMGDLDEDTQDVVPLPGGAYDVDGIAPIEEVEERLRIHLHTVEMRTVAGYLMERLGRMPKLGDRVVAEGYTFQVTDISGPRIRQVRIQRESSRENRAGAQVSAAATTPVSSGPINPQSRT